MLGCEFVGFVVEVGAKVSSFQMGDHVFDFIENLRCSRSVYMHC
ncbi:MAG TPA: hypothetical protein DCF44_06775 [Chitinophagaceae bacterium]|nr:hypothetical protein [Chitinophagaceae bacterium]